MYPAQILLLHGHMVKCGTCTSTIHNRQSYGSHVCQIRRSLNANPQASHRIAGAAECVTRRVSLFLFFFFFFLVQSAKKCLLSIIMRIGRVLARKNLWRALCPARISMQRVPRDACLTTSCETRCPVICSRRPVRHLCCFRWIRAPQRSPNAHSVSTAHSPLPDCLAVLSRPFVCLFLFLKSDTADA